MATFAWKQRAMFLPPLFIGVLLLALAPNMKAEPPKSAQTSGKKVVRVLNLVPRNIQPTAIGYGHTKPAEEWQAQAELDGTVVWVSQQLKQGAILTKGTVLLKIDPSSYQLSLAKLEAELEVSRLKDRTINASVAIANKDYQIQQAEYERSLRLSKTGHISKTQLDSTTRALLSSQQQFQTLKNSLIINQAEQQVLKTQIALAQRDLSHTVISAPFDLRVTEKLAGIADYINKGELLLKADGINRVEISAQFPLGKMRPLRRAENRSIVDNEIHSALQADVELNAGNKLIHWDAQVSRTGGQIDAQTQSQSIVISIDAPYKLASPGKKPPLMRDTFVKVTLKAPVLKKQLLIPVSAIHNNKVYTVNSKGKLSIKTIEIDFIQNQIAVVKSGIVAKDKIVLSKLSPAVEGMSLKPQPDKKIVQWLDKETGFTALKNKQAEDKS